MQLPRAWNKDGPTSVSLCHPQKLANQQGRQKETKTSESLQLVWNARFFGYKDFVVFVRWMTAAHSQQHNNYLPQEQLCHHEVLICTEAETCKIVAILDHESRSGKVLAFKGCLQHFDASHHISYHHSCSSHVIGGPHSEQSLLVAG